MTKFDIAMDFVFKNEGGWSNNSSDRGGATQYGITFKLFQKYWEDIKGESRPATTDDLKALTKEEAEKIYHHYFWQAHSLDNLMLPFTTIVFDQLVNRGLNAIISLQRAINKFGKDQVAVDGIMGPKSILAVTQLSYSERELLFIEFINDCQLSYVNIVSRHPDQGVFLKGWLARTHKYYALLLELSSGC